MNPNYVITKSIRSANWVGFNLNTTKHNHSMGGLGWEFSNLSWLGLTKSTKPLDRVGLELTHNPT